MVPGIGEVVLDAVYTRFDERPPGITRLVKKYTKVYNQMADIHHIQGIRIGTAAMPTAKDLAIEANDRAKLVKPTSFVDYTIMSEGEMSTFLLAQRDKMLSEFFVGTPQGAAYAQQFLQKRDALYRGLHRGFNLLGGVKAKTCSASGWLTLPEKGVNLKQGFRFLFDDAESGAERVGAIPQLDCAALYPINPSPTPYYTDEYYNYVQGQNALRTKCQTENLWRTELNKWWEKSGNVLLYEFITPANTAGLLINDYPILQNKTFKHIDFVNMVNIGSKITRSNLRLWMENGVMYSSIAGAGGQTLGPQLPQDYIQAFRQAGQSGINGFPMAVVGLAVDLLKLNYSGFMKLVDVLKGDATLKQAISSHSANMEAFFNKYADQVATLATDKDWDIPELPGGGDTPPPGGGGGSGSGSGFLSNLSQNEKLALAGAAALLLYGATKS
jgi:hypothetical protein